MGSEMVLCDLGKVAREQGFTPDWMYQEVRMMIILWLGVLMNLICGQEEWSRAVVISDKEEVTPISQEVRMPGFLWFWQWSRFVFTTWLQNVLVFVLLHYIHRVALSDVGHLCNCRYSPGEHQGPAVSMRSAPDCPGLFFSFSTLLYLPCWLYIVSLHFTCVCLFL